MIAPGRAQRPGAARLRVDEPTDTELDSCPFCEGREDRTPPETFRFGSEASWTVRVVPNLYPAFERQEVVIHSPRHVRTFAELTDQELAAVATAWSERAEEAWVSGYAYVHALVNEGRESGASLAHSHSQLVWLREEPPAVAEERTRTTEDACVLCELVARERHQGIRVVAERDGVTAFAAYAGRLPYELLIVGEHWGGQDGFDGGVFLVRALELLSECVRRLRTLEGAVPWNAWLHNSGHWHIEVLPRLSIQAGVELGAGIAINTLAPEEAARRLREA